MIYNSRIGRDCQISMFLPYSEKNSSNHGFEKPHTMCRVSGRFRRFGNPLQLSYGSTAALVMCHCESLSPDSKTWFCRCKRIYGNFGFWIKTKKTKEKVGKNRRRCRMAFWLGSLKLNWGKEEEDTREGSTGRLVVI